ncbi:hypothetical protein [uncultured Croceitalea sp.]|uniref:hypothetical protein n=1 Tax=uncultured Croceitalea sp. TaxID=1798908 RepID=UPI0033062295
MRTAFDNQIKSEIENLEGVPNVVFEEERIWKSIELRIHKGPNGQSSGIVLLAGLGLVGLFLAGSLFKTTHITSDTDNLSNEKKAATYQKGVVLDTTITIKTERILDLKLSDSRKKVAKTKSKETFKIEGMKMQSIAISDTQSILSPSRPKVGQLQLESSLVAVQKTTVHIYRPTRYVGSALVFRLKANGVLINRVKNGGHSVLKLSAGPTQFLIGKHKFDMQLKPDETYYLRVRYKGFPIGKPIIEWIAEDFAIKELSKNSSRK